MIHKVKGAGLSRHVVVADDLIGVQPVVIRQPGAQLHQGVVGGLGKLPRPVRMAALDGQSVLIALVGAVGHLVQGDALEDLPLQSDKEVAAGVGLSRLRKAGEIAAVLRRRGARVAHIVHHNPVDLLQGGAWPGVGVEGKGLPADPLQRLRGLALPPPPLQHALAHQQDGHQNC